MAKTMRKQFEEYAEMMVEQEGLEAFLERFDLSAIDTVMTLYDEGFLDVDLADDWDYEEIEE